MVLFCFCFISFLYCWLLAAGCCFALHTLIVGGEKQPRDYSLMCTHVSVRVCVYMYFSLNFDSKTFVDNKMKKKSTYLLWKCFCVFSLRINYWWVLGRWVTNSLLYNSVLYDCTIATNVFFFFCIFKDHLSKKS